MLARILKALLIAYAIFGVLFWVGYCAWRNF